MLSAAALLVGILAACGVLAYQVVAVDRPSPALMVAAVAAVIVFGAVAEFLEER